MPDTIRTAVLLAGGKGARLAPYTKILPKPLMPIGDMPILEVLLRQMKRAGVQRVILAVGHLAGLLEAFFQGGDRLGLEIEYSLEDQPMGTAGPLKLISGLDEPFFVANGDVLTTLDLRDLARVHRLNGAVATIATQSRGIPVDLGVVEMDEGNQIVNYIEKPHYEFKVSMGIYVFNPGVLSYIPSETRFDFPDLVLNLLSAGEKVAAYPFYGYWKDLGRPDDYEQAVMDFENLRQEILGE